MTNRLFCKTGWVVGELQARSIGDFQALFSARSRLEPLKKILPSNAI